jgi:hypothetical protein
LPCRNAIAFGRSTIGLTAPIRRASGTGAFHPTVPDSSFRSSSTALMRLWSIRSMTPRRRAGSAHALNVTCTARTGCAGRRGCSEIQTRFVVALRSVSVATRVTGPFGRCFHDSRNRPLETRTGRPLAVSVAPGSRVPASAREWPQGIVTPGGSNAIRGPTVSTRMFHVFVVREPGKPPGAVACTRCDPSRRRLPSMTKRPSCMYARPVTSTPSSFQWTRSSTDWSAPTENLSEGRLAGPIAA